MGTIKPEDVITKLKDDGDFDRLRRKIVHQLKQNEDLRNNIIAVVKQSAALNRPGAENMKPRQLCDAIHEEIQETVMKQISDGLWEIIRSGDDMKTEIKETVQSVYDKLLDSQRKSEGGETTSSLEHLPVIVSGVSNGSMPNGDHNIATNHDMKSKTQQPGLDNRRLPEQERASHQCNGSSRKKDKDHSPSPSAGSSGKRKRSSNVTDEDPEIPPGFG